MREKYTPADGDITVSIYKGQDEYSIWRIENGVTTYQPFAKGKIDPSLPDSKFYRPAYHSLLQWAKLSGRHISELACVIPNPPMKLPREFLRVVHPYNDAKRAITKRIPIPQFIVDAWGTADSNYIHTLIREHVKFLYDISHIRPISNKDPKLDDLVVRRMATSRGQPFSTQI